MSTVVAKPTSADELAAMGNIGRCELIYGELVMMSPASPEHGFVALRLGRLIGSHVDELSLGAAFGSETGFQLDQDLVLAPDVGVVLAERLPPTGVPTSGYFKGPPDLAVEVVSPGDTKREVAEKVSLWLRNSCRSCWVADPLHRTIRVHGATGEVASFSEEDELCGDSVLPRLVLSVSKVFRL